MPLRSFASRRLSPLTPEGFSCNAGSLLVSSLAITMLSLALPVMSLQIYDRILPNQGSGTLPVLTMGVCTAVMLELALRLMRGYAIGRAGAAYEHRMSCLMLGKVLLADLAKAQWGGVGEYLHRMGSVGKLKDFYNGQALTVAAELLFVPLSLGLIALIAGILVLVPAFILLLFTGVSLLNGRHLRDMLRVRESADDHRFDFLIEALEGVHTLKSFAMEKYFERRYEALEETSTFANYEVTRQTALTFNSGAIFGHLMMTAVISAGAWCVLEGRLTTGSLIATMLLSGRLMQPVQKALVLWTRYQDFVLASAHVTDVLETPQQETAPRAHEQPVFAEGRLTLQQVTFGYGKGTTPVIADASLELRPGEAVLISGGHGCGKTTLFKLMAGLYPANSGEILVEGEAVATYRPQELSRHIAYIRTEAMIFRGSIRDNMTGFGQIEEGQAREISALMAVDRDVAKLPGGFDTFLSGNETDNIPLGLKQRISIVRALARKPRLILFDNAEVALDREGYEHIYQLLARLKSRVSMVLVSDDRNIRSLADRHYTLQDGHLEESASVPVKQMFLQGYREPAL